MRITNASHPAIFAAFLCIDYDNGAVTRDDPERTFVDVPAHLEAELQQSEHELLALTDEELDLLCTGEETERLPVTARCPAADRFLNEYFDTDGWRCTYDEHADF